MEAEGLIIGFKPYPAHTMRQGKAIAYVNFSGPDHGDITVRRFMTPEQLRALAYEANQAADQCDDIATQANQQKPPRPDAATITGIDTVDIAGFNARHSDEHATP